MRLAAFRRRFQASKSLGFRSQLRECVCCLQDGLVLFTSPTGSGKSTSLAALIHKINAERAEHIIRNHRAAKLKFVLQTVSPVGMVTVEADAKRLLKERKISKETFAWARL